ncbi:hypothetical protein B0J18DRAFT_180959 [Chaetomium sp. MPI-SDFR-AT-0129]|nr:hypothetical protein B0J18DRAFT_180959 [Chaetomium sp. MPI-SDFR-AT-0129]
MLTFGLKLHICFGLSLFFGHSKAPTALSIASSVIPRKPSTFSFPFRHEWSRSKGRQKPHARIGPGSRLAEPAGPPEITGLVGWPLGSSEQCPADRGEIPTQKRLGARAD